MGIGERIRCAREEARLSQVKLAEVVGVDSNTISRWERNLYRVTSDYVPKLALALNTTVANLLSEEEAAETLNATAIDHSIANINGMVTAPNALREDNIVFEFYEGKRKIRLTFPKDTPGDVVAKAIKAAAEDQNVE